MIKNQMNVLAVICDGWMHLIAAFRYSLAGIKTCWKQETAFRQECAMAIPHLVAICIVTMELWLRFYLVALLVIVLVVELLNTAIEAVVDIASPGRHELAKKAKDCGSAAVFCLLLLLAASWIIVLIRVFAK